MNDIRTIRNETKQSHLLILTFFTGFYGIILQSVIIREILVVCFGNELSIGLTLAGWLCGISAGAYIAGKIRADKTQNYLLTSLVLMPLSSFPLIIGIRYSRIICNVQAGEYIPFVELFLISILLVSTASFFVGFTFPLFCTLRNKISPNKEDGITAIYIAESAGSLAGGCIFTFFFAVYSSTVETLIVINIVAFILLSLFLPQMPGRGRKIKVSLIFPAIAVLMLLSLISGWSQRIDDITVKKRWQSLAGSINLLESADTRYQNIAVGESGGQYSTYLNGHYSFSFPDAYSSSVTANFIMNQHPDPKRILFIGEGLSGIIEVMLSYPVENIDYVELDPRLIELTEKYAHEESLKAISDKRLKIHFTDGRYFVMATSKLYDMIFTNLPDPSNAMLNRMYTEDFFRQAEKKLMEGGVFITSISSPSNYLAGEQLLYISSIYNSMKGVFKNLIATPGERMFLMGGDSPSAPTSDIRTLDERYTGRNIKDAYFTPYHFELILPTERVEFVNNRLSSSASVLPNTDLRPVSYLYNLILWDFYSSSGKGKAFFAPAVEYLRKLDFLWFCALPLMLLLIRLGYLLLRDKKQSRDETLFNAKSAIFITGFSGMALSLILLFSFQSIFGYLYSFIGLIVALFMGGLTLGGYAGKKYSGDITESRGALLFNQLMLMFFLILMPYILKSFSGSGESGILISQLSFALLLPVSGFLTGIQFPLSGRILSQSGLSIQESAGSVDSMDHLGAFLGAIATGIILIPVLGIELTCYLIGFINLLIAVLWAAFFSYKL